MNTALFNNQYTVSQNNSPGNAPTSQPMSNSGNMDNLLKHMPTGGYGLPEGYAQMMAQQQQKTNFYGMKRKEGESSPTKNGLEQDDDEDSDTVKEKSTRRKIKIEYIKDKSRRHITFSKRKAGIMKKAYELSTLTGTQVLLLVVSETGLVYTFTTPKLQPLVTKSEGKNLIQSCLNAPDPNLFMDPQRSSMPSPGGAYQLYSDLGFDKSLANSSHTGSPLVTPNYGPDMSGYGFGGSYPSNLSNSLSMSSTNPGSSPFMPQFDSFAKPMNPGQMQGNNMNDYWSNPNMDFNSPCLNQPNELQDHLNPTLENHSKLS